MFEYCKKQPFQGSIDIDRDISKNILYYKAYYSVNVKELKELYLLDNKTIFYYASNPNHDFNFLKLVINKDDNLDLIKDNDGNNICHYIALSGRYANLKQALKYVYDYMYNKQRFYGPDLKYSISTLDYLASFFKQNNNHIMFMISLDSSMKNNHGDTVWHYLARSGNCANIKLAIEDFNLDPLNLKNNNGMCLWHCLAISAKYEDFKKAIKEFNLDPLSIKNNGYNLWHYLALSGRYAELKLAIKEYKLDFEYLMLWSCLVISGHDNYKNILKDIKNNDINPLIKNKDGQNLWHLLALSGIYYDNKDKDIVSLNLDMENMKDNKGLNLLHCLALSGNYIAFKQAIIDYNLDLKMRLSSIRITGNYKSENEYFWYNLLSTNYIYKDIDDKKFFNVIDVRYKNEYLHYIYASESFLNFKDINYEDLFKKQSSIKNKILHLRYLISSVKKDYNTYINLLLIFLKNKVLEKENIIVETLVNNIDIKDISIYYAFDNDLKLLLKNIILKYIEHSSIEIVSELIIYLNIHDSECVKLILKHGIKDSWKSDTLLKFFPDLRINI